MFQEGGISIQAKDSRVLKLNIIKKKWMNIKYISLHIFPFWLMLS